MGNSNSHHGGTSRSSSGDEKSQGGSGTVTPHGGSRKGMSRSASGADIQDKTPSQFLPVEKLSKILLQKSQDEEGVQGITADAFVRYVFPKYQDIGYRLFKHLHTNARATTAHLGVTAFRQQCERFLGVLDDSLIMESYVRMFAEPENPDGITPDGLRALLMTCYQLAMSHYSDGPQTCLLIHRTLTSVVESCFHSKIVLSPGFVYHWLEQHCPRLVPPVHRFCIHTLSTAYRGIETMEAGLGLELATPILDKPPAFGEKKELPLLPVSFAWLLAGALPPLYSKPQNASSPSNSGTNLVSQHFMAKLLSVVPSHWALLYNSREHGLGANRFLHHVLAYKGPTLILLRGENGHVYCVGAPSEWKESHLYWGGNDCAVIELLPNFSLIEKGPKMLYLNTSIRGYPKGLRAGKDPRKPLITVDESFEKFEYRGIPYPLLSLEVWGCGDQQSREAQIDVKKWQKKEAERQRQVKLSAADWLDHPDRYLLELAGRPQYSDKAS